MSRQGSRHRRLLYPQRRDRRQEIRGARGFRDEETTPGSLQRRIRTAQDVPGHAIRRHHSAAMPRKKVPLKKPSVARSNYRKREVSSRLATPVLSPTTCVRHRTQRCALPAETNNKGRAHIWPCLRLQVFPVRLFLLARTNHINTA